MRESCVRLVLIAGLMPLFGCAAFQNTAAQDRTWSAWYACRAENRTTGVQLVRVDPYGYYTLQANYYRPQFSECMAEKLGLENPNCAITRSRTSGARCG